MSFSDEHEDEAFNERFKLLHEQSVRARIDRNRAAEKAEQRRVTALLGKDRAYRAQEATRRAAEIEVAEGRYVNLSDTVVPPTPEWEQHGETRPYIPRQPKETVRVIKTVRRVQTPIVVRLRNSGKIDDEQFLACCWYADCYERAGISGRYKTSSFSGMPGSPGGVGQGQHPAAKHAGEVQARRALRSAREGIEERLLRIFDLIVVENLPLRRAARAATTDNSAIFRKFVEVCDAIVRHCEVMGVDLQDYGRRRS